MGKKKTIRELDTSLLEIIYRSHRDITVDEHAPLEKKTNNKELLARLLDLERVILERARQKGIIRE